MSSGEEFGKGFWRENPVLILLLGLCPTLAVTTSAYNGMGMGLATTAVLVCSNVVVVTYRVRTGRVHQDALHLPL